VKHCVDMESARVTTGNRVSVAKAMSPRIGGFANIESSLPVSESQRLLTEILFLQQSVHRDPCAAICLSVLVRRRRILQAQSWQLPRQLHCAHQT